MLLALRFFPGVQSMRFPTGEILRDGFGLLSYFKHFVILETIQL